MARSAAAFVLILAALPLRAQEPLRKVLFTQLAAVISIVKQHIRPFLESIFQVVNEFWGDEVLLSEHILSVVEEITISLKDDFAAYIPTILPKLVRFLTSDGGKNCKASLKVLRMLQEFGSKSEAYLHLVIPSPSSSFLYILQDDQSNFLYFI